MQNIILTRTNHNPFATASSMSALRPTPAASVKETHSTIVRASLLNQNTACKGALHLDKRVKQAVNKQ